MKRYSFVDLFKKIIILGPIFYILGALVMLFIKCRLGGIL